MKYGISFFLSVTLVGSAYTQSIEMVKDIMPDSNINPPVFSGSQIEGLTAIDNAVYFKASDGESTNLWTSDGTENGTLKVPYPEEGITVSDMIKYNGDIFYIKHSGVYPAYENLFLKVGTNLESIEVLPGLDVKDILGVYLDKIFLLVKDAATGTEIWTSDGTSEGTTLLKDINPNADASSSSSASVECIEHNGILYFAKDDNGSPINVELWKTDGTTDGTVKVKEINEETGSYQSSAPSNFFVLNNEVHFLAYSPEMGGSGLWKTDGTESGTVFITPYTATLSTVPVYFDGYWYIGAWRTDGTQAGSGLYTEDIYTLPLVVYNNRLLFGRYTSISTPFSSTFSLYATDGTEGGTALLLEADGERGYYGGLRIIQAEIVNGRVYFLASKYEENYQDYGYLWATDGTPEGTQLLTPSSDIHNYYYNNEIALRGAPVYGKSFTVNNNEIYFAAMFDAEIGYELYKMQPLPAPVVSVSDESLKPNDLKVFPNPASEIIQLQNQGQQIADIQLLDSRGRSVPLPCEVNGQGQITFHVHSLPTGVYMIRLMTHLGEVHHTRWIKH